MTDERCEDFREMVLEFIADDEDGAFGVVDRFGMSLEEVDAMADDLKADDLEFMRHCAAAKEEKHRLKEAAIEARARHPLSLQNVADEVGIDRAILDRWTSYEAGHDESFRKAMDSAAHGAMEKRKQEAFNAAYEKWSQAVESMADDDSPKDAQAKAATVLHLTRALDIIEPKWKSR